MVKTPRQYLLLTVLNVAKVEQVTKQRGVILWVRVYFFRVRLTSPEGVGSSVRC